MLTIGAAALAPWEVDTLRHTLAPVLMFTRRYHQQPYCLSTLPMELGAYIEPFREDELTLPAYFVANSEERLVKLNDAVSKSPARPLAIAHECGHFLLGQSHSTCTEKLESREERDVWFAAAILAISADMARCALQGHATVADIAARCHVPEALVMIRLALVTVLDGRRSHLSEALHTIRYWLGRLEQWIEAVKAQIAWQALTA